MKLSVVICAHNPRKDFIERTLAALEAQTMDRGGWELIVIDNCSDPAIESWVQVDWHPNARVIREERLGLTPARLRGIDESIADIIVYVDDDNLLAANYLENALSIGNGFPQLGAWGGHCEGEFVDGLPDEWTKEYWFMLAICDVDKDRWSNSSADSRVLPAGAGMVIRRNVAEAYKSNLQTSPLRRSLDRQGSDLISGGDVDLVLTAFELGMGVGRFASLRLRHLIPASRLTEEYLLKLAEGITCSIKLLRAIRGTVEPEPNGIIRRIRRVLRLMAGGRRSRKFRFGLAIERGLRRADVLLAEFAARSSDSAMKDGKTIATLSSAANTV